MGMAEKIRIVLVKKKITLKELASRLGCSPANISHKLTRDNFSEQELRDIAEALGCEFEACFLLPETGERV